MDHGIVEGIALEQPEPKKKRDLCFSCGGSGIYKGERCPDCNGRGTPP